MKTNFHNKNFALSLAVIMRFKATLKWPIASSCFPALGAGLRVFAANSDWFIVLPSVFSDWLE